jgi:acetyl-CoA carboxylase biotin carboxyl carrier protein
MTDEKGPSDPIDARLVRRLAAILRDTELSEIEVARGDLKIRVKRELTHAAPVPTYAPQPVQPAPAAAQSATPVPVAAPELNGEVVKSPMVGTVYLQPQPGADPFIKPGARIRQGQTLLIVEAMKTMNPIPAPRDGVVLEVLVSDSQPVEFGEPLVVLE